MHPDVVLALQGQDGNRNAVSRQGGSRLAPRVPPTRLVVDVREFMSSLPAVLYQQGLNLVPLTLEVNPPDQWGVLTLLFSEHRLEHRLEQNLHSKIYHQSLVP